MSLVVHRAPRADLLVTELAGLLRTPLPDPFEQDLVLVPAKGIERWLSQQLSHRLGAAAGREDGVCAGVEFRSPASLVAEVTGTVDDDPWAPDVLVWPLLDVIDAHAGADWCHTLGLHLGHGQDGEEAELRRGRRYAVALRLARLLASYAVQRPTLLEAWEAGQDSDGAGGVLPPDLTWQPELWRHLVSHVGEPSPGRRHQRVLRALRERPDSVELPARFSLFGHTRIPVTEVELLDALAAHRDVHLWLPHPSPALWQALSGHQRAVRRRDDDSHGWAGHPLLASLGRDLRELQRTLQTVPHVDGGETGEETGAGDHLLGWLQRDIAANAITAGRALRPDDRSLQVHACHGPARQVEVLREVLLGLLADDPTLEPRDILVMCPDIEAYAPLISAAFGMGEIGTHPGHQLRVRLADRSLTQTNPLLAVVGSLLDLAGGRAEASRVLDLLAADPVRRRFNFSQDDLETITGWVDKAGIRWAFDAEHRAPYGLEGYVQNTWRFGLDRVLAGVAVSDDADRFFGATLPLDDVGSTSIDLAGRFAEYVERVRATCDRLTGSHPVAHWMGVLGDAVTGLTDVGRGEEWQQAQVHRELGRMADATTDTQLELRLADVRALMRERLAGRPTRANFRTGTLTVATLVPMRSVPHRVVCLLGLDDGVFPRTGAVDGDDLLARDPRTGERDRRSEDRQLMLDAIVAATEHLVVTYSGANETTGRPRPPAVPLGELLDTLEQTAAGARDHVLRHHPLQAFDPQNLQPGKPFSFDVASLAGARAATRKRVAPPSLSDLELPPREGDVELADLVRFFKHPVKEFLRRRLDLALPDDGEEVSDGLPVELDGLGQWAVGDRMLRDLLAGHDRTRVLGKEWRRGSLPPGQLGWRMANEIVDKAIPVADCAESVMQGRAVDALDVDVDLGDDRRLRGTVTDLYGDRLIKVTYSRMGPKQLLDVWIPLLALCAARPGRPWTAGVIARAKPVSRATFTPVDDAPALLADLVRLYDSGMREPLPLPLKTCEAWARHHQRPKQAWFKANDAWAKDKFAPERDDGSHARIWGRGADLETLLAVPPRPGEEWGDQESRLGALACRLWTPILERVIS